MPGLVVVGLDAQISIYPAASNIHGQLYEPLHHGCMEFVACVAPRLSVATSLHFQPPPDALGYFRCAESTRSCMFGTRKRAQQTICDVQTAIKRVDERVHQ